MITAPYGAEERSRLTRDLGEALVVEGRRRRSVGLPVMDAGADQAFADHFLINAIATLSRERMARAEAPLELPDEERLRQEVFQAYFYGGKFQQLLQLPDVTDVFLNGADFTWIVYSDGRRVLWPERIFLDDEDLINEVARLARTAGRTERRFDVGSPMLTLRLPDGSRLAAIREVSGSPHVAIRRNLLEQVNLDELYQRRMIDRGMLSLFRAIPVARQRCLISGETGAGKTTLLRGFVSELPVDTRIIVIEDTKELDLGSDIRRRPSVLEWETREPNMEGAGGVEQSDLLKISLRFNPEWIYVAEVRDRGAAREMTLAMQHGHPSMSTIHHHSASGAPSKLAQYMAQGQGSDGMPYEIAQRIISESIDFFIHLDRDSSGRRVVAEVCEVAGFESGQVLLNHVYAAGFDGRGRPQPHMTDARRARLVRAGFDWSLLQNPDGWWAP